MFYTFRRNFGAIALKVIERDKTDKSQDTQIKSSKCNLSKLWITISQKNSGDLKSLIGAEAWNCKPNCITKKKKKAAVRVTCTHDVNVRVPGGGGYLGQFLLGLCRWPLRTPTPL